MIIHLLLIVGAVICFALSATRFVTDPVRIIAIGLALLSLSMII